MTDEQRASVNICPTCKSSFRGGEQFCPRDGTPLRSSLPEDPLAGRVLSGRYRLVEVIGRGGMGAVYRAHHILMDKPVAVKVLRQELASDTEAVARFHREARSASRLDHDNIIRVSDFGQTDDGLLFLVMELLDGENLAQLLKRGGLPWRRAAAIARDVALGLSHAHEQGVIHRDLKPENIVLVRRGKARQLVKVLDFGLAKLVQVAPQSGELPSEEPDVAVQSLTRTGVIFGTPEYMSPEQAEGRPLDARTDIYALGVVTYQMLSGRLPFTAPTFLALIAKTVQEPPPPLSELLPPPVELPVELEALVLSCLAKSPDGRPQRVEEVAEELEALLLRMPPSDEPTKSGELAATSSGAAPAVAGGVARTVQRQLRPGQSPLHSPREATPADGSEPTSSAADPLPAPVEPPLPPPSGSRPPTASGSRPPSPEAPAAELPSGRQLESVERELPAEAPRRAYRWAGLGLLALLGGGGYLAWPLLVRPPPPPVTIVEREPLRQARELLSQTPLPPTAVDEALRLLRQERESYHTPEVHRLLSRAYEAQNNRLRALGHLYVAVQLGGGPSELGRSQLALAQLLSRLGHPTDACQSLPKLGRAGLEPSLQKPVAELAASLHCPR